MDKKIKRQWKNTFSHDIVLRRLCQLYHELYLGVSFQANVGKSKNASEIILLQAKANVSFHCRPDWQQQFDSIITYSRKPSFFYSNNHFRRLGKENKKILFGYFLA